MKWTTVLFDLDGTLTDSIEGIVRSAAYGLTKVGITPPPDAELRSFAGPPLHSYFMEYAHLSAEDADRAVAAFREFYNREGMYMNRVYPGIAQLLPYLRRSGVKIACVTSKETSQAVAVLRQFGILQNFDAVVGCTIDDTNASKQKLITRALQTLGVTDPGQAAMVGDRFYDMEGAKAAGVHAVGVAYGYGTREELLHSGAESVAASVQELGYILTVPASAGNAVPASLQSREGSGVPGPYRNAAPPVRNRQNMPYQPPQLRPGTAAQMPRRRGFFYIFLPVLVYLLVTNLISSLALSAVTSYQLIQAGGPDLSAGTDSYMQQIYDIMYGFIASEAYYPFQMYVNMICDVILIPIFYLFLRKDRKEDFGQNWNLRSVKKPGWANTGLAVVMGFSISLVINLLIAITGISEWMYNMNPARYDMMDSLPLGWNFIAICIFAPIAEELLFRGLVFGRMRKRTGFIAAAICSAAIFGVVHLDVVTGIAAFLIGVIMAVLYEYTGSLLLPMFFHFGFNFFSIVADLMGDTLGTIYPYLIPVFALLAIAAIVIFLKRNKPQE